MTTLLQGGYNVIPPTGDILNGQDRININNSIAAGYPTMLEPGYYELDQPLIMDRGNACLKGPHWAQAVLRCRFTKAQPAILITGNTFVPFQPVVQDIQIDANTNAFSGHGWMLRAEVPYGKNIEVKNFNTPNADLFHFSPGDLTATARDTYEMYNLFGAAAAGGLGANSNGLFLDSKVTSSEFYGCHFNGNIVPSVSGAYGINDNGSGNKFYGCHPYAFASGAYINTGGFSPFIDGGEYENCGGPNFTFNNCRNAAVHGAQSYGTVNTGPDILVQNTSNFITFLNVRHNSSAVSMLYSLDGTILDATILAANSQQAIANAITAAAGGNRLIAQFNHFQGGTIVHSGAADIVGSNV